ncbi:uncharacterized protein BJ171DRAFT_582941 [Polychytrium aggregatum]|uniref:uncharacterized protein n=1 Tax=Polychytrium aggregatum TaxID=110093 RepID=UPI0022FE968F|nr:uncharacterized protein BJ171DRAFT_582941 [Polychytrium aggregatum]KAI9203440.1 hypothetical protein BJ171DRAFT_582941 [Polychytrium aggregatum]
MFARILANTANAANAVRAPVLGARFLVRYNRVILVGNLPRAPVYFSSKYGKDPSENPADVSEEPVAASNPSSEGVYLFNIVTETRKLGKRETQWHNIKAIRGPSWRVLPQNFEEYLPGSIFVVEGKLEYYKNTKTGVNSTRIVADKVRCVRPKRANQELEGDFELPQSPTEDIPTPNADKNI